VVTLKGIKFVYKWYYRDYIPPHIVGPYQLILRLIWMRGIMALYHSLKSTKWGKIINQALSQGYVKIVEKPHLSSKEIRDRIEQMIGKAPREIYV
jgi:hypothetical protein